VGGAVGGALAGSTGSADLASLLAAGATSALRGSFQVNAGTAEMYWKVCLPCPPGKYQGSAGAPNCRACPAGKTTRALAGAFTASVGPCEPACYAGNYLVTELPAAAANRSAAAAAADAAAARKARVALQEAAFADSINGRPQPQAPPRKVRFECRVCPLGKFQPRPWRDSCLSCPVGRTTLTPESVTGKLCLPACEPGKYLTVDWTADAQARRAHMEELAAHGGGLSLTAGGGGGGGAGSFIGWLAQIMHIASAPATAGAIVCAPCPRGRYQPGRLSRSCLECEAGLTTWGVGETTRLGCIRRALVLAMKAAD
jgi:hypothetical protein